ncbi:carbohydrate-binding module family 50 protein [Venturia nashicola]|uniref:Carbohydrate-binding module family 50 protein n=1 Tax=Venturia nashicola TaxID=86259 RepID=A0A4Z1PAW7_9PEZI|nr:carbohydrate-binding module family 50 protein [Venturia nashicola]
MSFFVHTLVVAGSISALVLGLPAQFVPLTRIGTVATPDSSFSQRLPERGTRDVYRMYTGTGQWTSWPSMDQWVSSFDEMFAINKQVINSGCSQFNVATNSAQETSSVAKGIKTVAAETGIDPRFILAILLQESNGCVRAPTTNYGVRNPGLMQDHDGSATCNEAGHIQNPCPTPTITQMIRDGVAGTPAGDGLVQTMAKTGSSGTSKYYISARIYNSGSLAANGDLGGGVATHCYVSDVANRLTGWVYAKKTCSLDGGSVDEAYIAPPLPLPATPKPEGPVVAEVHEDGPEQVAHEVAHEVAPEEIAPVPVALTQEAPAPPAEPEVIHEAHSIIPSAPSAEPETIYEAHNIIASSPKNNKVIASKLAPGATTDCAKYYNIQNGDVCSKVSRKFTISLEQLRQMNTQIDAGCSNLWLGYDYCVLGL